MSKKVFIILTVLIIAIFLVVRVVGKRGIKQVASEAKKPAVEAQVGGPEAKSKVVATPEPSTPENIPKLRIPAEEKESLDRINKMNPMMAVIMGAGGKTDYFTRIKAVHGLGKELSDSAVNVLFILLNRKTGEDGLPLEQLNALKNDVVNVLKSQTRKPVDLANNLMAMYYDSPFAKASGDRYSFAKASENKQPHDGVWRDYCVQHLGSFYPKIGNAEEQKMARGLFWAATHETDSSIAGTALIALVNNSDQPDISKDAVANRALLLSEDPKCGELAKITSLQICAKLGEGKVLPIARQIAVSGASVPLRISAVAAVGTLGEESDRAMLEKYAASTDTRLRTAAQSALKRLGKK